MPDTTATTTAAATATTTSAASSVARRFHRFRPGMRMAATLGLLLVLAGCASSSEPSDTATPGGLSTTAAEVPSPSLAENREWTGTLLINGSPLTITLDGVNAPQAVASFLYLADTGYFEETDCHRLAPSISVLQCGDPTGTGSGGPGYSFGPIENDPVDGAYPAGTLAMARIPGDGNSMGSQFFIVYADTTISSDVAGGYTVFGEVTAGLDVVTAIAAGGVGADGTAPATPATISGLSFE